MMATRRINAATTFLIRAFAPVCPTNLRCWSSKKVKIDGVPCERVTINYDLPDQAAFSRGLELEASAPTLRLMRVGRTIVREIKADVSGQYRVLTVTALLGSDLDDGGWQ